MQYIEMTIEDAMKLFKGKKGTVLVAVTDLEKNTEISGFIKKSKSDCENIIKEAETVARVYDSFMNQLRVFTEKQIDIKNIEPHGKLNTILFKV